MSYIQSISSVDLFEELYHRSPVPKNILFSDQSLHQSPSKQVNSSSFSGPKSQIYNKLKDRSLLSTSKSPLPISISRSFHNGSTQNIGQLVNDLTGPRKLQNDVLLDRSEINSLNTSQAPANTSQSAASLFNKIKLLSPNNDINGQNKSRELFEDEHEHDKENKSSKKDCLDGTASASKGTVAEVVDSIQLQRDYISPAANDDDEEEEIEEEPPVYELYSWIIKPLPESKAVCVEGKRHPDDEQYYHSSQVVARLSQNVVKTANGSKYILMGNIETLDALEAGITEELAKSFRTGFPLKWKSCIAHYYSKVVFLDEGDKLSTGPVQGTDQLTSHNEVDVMPEKKKKTKKGSKNASQKKEGGEIIGNVREREEDMEISQNNEVVNEYILTDWIIKPIVDTEDICVEGRKSENSEEYWHSTAIQRIINKRSVVSNSGSVYWLQGKISSLDMLEAGFSKKIIKAFTDGFPKSWKAHVKRHFADMKSQEDFLTPKPHRTGTSSTACTPSGMAYEIDSIKKTRSGRVCKPALAWWAGQRVKTYNDGTFEVIYNSPGASDIMKSMTVPYNDLPKVYQNFMNSSTIARTNAESGNSTVAEESENSKKIHEKEKEDGSKKKRKSSEKKKSVSNATPHVSEKGTGKSHPLKEAKHSNKKSKSSKKNKETDSKTSKSLTSRSSQQDSAESEIDSLVEDLKNSVRNAKSRKKQKVKKETCYSKITPSVKNHLKSGDTYCVDMDSDLDSDESIQGPKKSQTKSKKDGKGPLIEKKSLKLKKSTGTELLKTDQNNHSSEKPDTVSNEKRVTRQRNNKRGKNDIKQKNLTSASDEVSEDAKKIKKTTKKKVTEKSSVPAQRKRKSVELSTSSDESSDEDDFSSKTGTVKANRTQSRIQKPVSTEQVKDRPWTKQEIVALNRAVASVPADDPNFWDFVSHKVESRTSEECVEQYYKDGPKSNKKKVDKNSAKPKQVTGITAKKGTLKRKQQIREMIEQHNEGYEDDLFESTPYRKQGGIKMPKLMDDDEDDDIFDELAKKHPHLLNRIYTPLTRVHLEPMSEKKTPASSLESPFTNVDRKEAEHYIHQLQKRRHLKGRKILDKDKTPVNKKLKKKSASPMKNLFGKGVDTQVLFTSNGSSSENHEDSEIEQDYYWSDSEV